ncbi:SDR family NAD(P)-dependent oxidoreductase [Colwelliaceae bacterium 6441]
MSDENKVVAITGGNSGIGLAIAQLFLNRGYKVAIFARSIERMEQFKQASPDDIFIYSGDVCRADHLEDFYFRCAQKWGNIDTVIANAGVAIPENIQAITEESFDKSVNINFKGVFFTVQKSLNYLKEGSSIVLISSIQAQRGAGIWSVYGATKAAVRSLARSFAQELAGREIRVNALSPGVTETPILDKFGFEEDNLKGIIKQVSENTPLGRLGKPIEVARAALFLASDDASFITGSDLQVDGGLAQI